MRSSTQTSHIVLTSMDSGPTVFIEFIEVRKPNAGA